MAEIWETFLGGAGTSQEVGAQVLSVRPGQNGGFGLSDVSSQVGKENCQCPRQTCSARSQHVAVVCLLPEGEPF